MNLSKWIGIIVYRSIDEKQGKYHRHKFSITEPTILPNVKIKPIFKQKQRKLLWSLILIPSDKIVLKKLLIKGKVDEAPVISVFMNGFQSWSESTEFTYSDRMPGLNPYLGWWVRKFKLAQFGDYKFVRYSKAPGVFHGFTYTYLRFQNSMLLAGSLDESNAYTIFRWYYPLHRLQIERECEKEEIDTETKVLDLFFNQGAEAEIFNSYWETWKLPKPKVEASCGWTSWYHYYEKINEKIVYENINNFKNYKIPIDIFQIDDGYQQAVGDWLTINKDFPGGMKKIADTIKTAGYTPGIWVAPFIAEQNSALLMQHPEWFLRDESGNLISALNNPFNWSGHAYSLDIFNTDVQEYLKYVFTVLSQTWGFEMFKLDFLYAAALIPRKGKSRGTIMREALQFLRDILKDNLILGCGVPLGTAFGLVDYCRIGSDVSLGWETKKLKLLGHRERYSTINSLKNTIGRRHLNGNPFLNDPDVFILRNENNTLNEKQKHTLFVCNNIFGELVFTSDNIANYGDTELNLYKSMFPLRSKQIEQVIQKHNFYKVIFHIDALTYIGFINLGNRVETERLPAGYFYSSLDGFIKGDSNISVDPYETKILHSVPSDPFCIAGSTHSLFPGSEVVEISVQGYGNIYIKLHEKSFSQGRIFIKVPRDLQACIVNSNEYKVEDMIDFNLVAIQKKELYP